MIKKLEQMLTPELIPLSEGSVLTKALPNVIIPAEEAAKIFAVLLSVSNLLDAPISGISGGRLISELDLYDCLARGMERITISTEDLAAVQKAWKGLG